MTAKEASTAGLGGLGAQLRAMAQGRDTLDVAQVQFIDMDEIRRAYGQRWPEQKTRIHEIAESFLKRRMRPDDLLVHGSDGFLIIFGSTGAEASLSANQLAHGLNAFFLGEATRTPVPQVSARTATVSVKDLVARLGDSTFISATPEPAAAAPRAGPDCDWRYQPVWDVKRETLTNWYVTPYSPSAGTRLPGYQFEDAPVVPGLFAEIDHASLGVAEQALRQLIAQGKQALVGSSFHVSSLTNLAVRARLLSTLDQLDPALVRYRVLKVAAIPPGMPRHHLTEVVGMLRSRLTNVVLGAAWDEPDITSLASCDSVAIGLSIPAWVSSPTSNVSRSVLNARISEAVSAAHSVRKRLFVEGAVTPELAARLRLLGVDNISSGIIWTPTIQPDGMLKWPADRLTVAA